MLTLQEEVSSMFAIAGTKPDSLQGVNQTSNRQKGKIEYAGNRTQ
jgi:hypothetical protein